MLHLERAHLCLEGLDARGELAELPLDGIHLGIVRLQVEEGRYVGMYGHGLHVQ